MTSQHDAERSRSINEAASAYAAVLWDERERLEELLFALTNQNLLLSAGKIRFLAAADAQVVRALKALSLHELTRVMIGEDFLRMKALAPESTLSQIVQAVEEPWFTLFSDHRDGLLTLATEVAEITAENRRMLMAGAEMARETLARVTNTVDPAAISTTGMELFSRNAEQGKARGEVAPVLFDGRA